MYQLSAVDRTARIRSAIERVHANATGTWHGGPVHFGVILGRSLADGGGYLTEAVTAEQCAVSLCVANCPGIAEGSTGLLIDGKPCRITGPVVADAGGWATFPVVFLDVEEFEHAAP